eukprot:COSAG06_NODE_1907_length_8089_cov_27.903254_7_plen_195_part_00
MPQEGFAPTQLTELTSPGIMMTPGAADETPWSTLAVSSSAGTLDKTKTVTQLQDWTCSGITVMPGAAGAIQPSTQALYGTDTTLDVGAGTLTPPLTCTGVAMTPGVAGAVEPRILTYHDRENHDVVHEHWRYAQPPHHLWHGEHFVRLADQHSGGARFRYEPRERNMSLHWLWVLLLLAQDSCTTREKRESIPS